MLLEWVVIDDSEPMRQREHRIVHGIATWAFDMPLDLLEWTQNGMRPSPVIILG